MDIKRISTDIHNPYKVYGGRLKKVIAEVRANRGILERLEKQERVNARAIVELKEIMMTHTPDSGSTPRVDDLV